MQKDDSSRYIASKADTTSYVISFSLIVILALWKMYRGVPYDDFFVNG